LTKYTPAAVALVAAAVTSTKPTSSTVDTWVVASILVNAETRLMARTYVLLKSIYAILRRSVQIGSHEREEDHRKSQTKSAQRRTGGGIPLGVSYGTSGSETQ
jgi:hypothetical protein